MCMPSAKMPPPPEAPKPPPVSLEPPKVKNLKLKEAAGNADSGRGKTAGKRRGRLALRNKRAGASTGGLNLPTGSNS